MAVSYPLSFPTISGVANITLGASNAVAISRSPFTYQAQTQSYGGQMWRASVIIPPLPRADAESWVAFLLKLKGQRGTFLMGDPAGKTGRGVLTGTPLVKGANQTGPTLTIDGCGANVSNWIRTGDYIQLGSGSTARLYKCLNAETSDGTGTVTIDIWPDLRTSPADDATVVVSNTVGQWRLSSNQSDWDINDASFYGIQFDCEEAL